MSNTEDDTIELIKRQLAEARSMGGNLNISITPKVLSTAHVSVAIKANDDDFVEKTKTIIKLGYASLIEEIQKQSKEGFFTFDYLSEPLPLNAFHITDDVLDLIADPAKRGPDGIEKTKCTEESLLVFYLIAKKLYDDRLLDEAANAFTLLSQIAPQVSPFWLGLGISLEAKQEWPQAIEALHTAIKVDPSDFSPFQVLIRIAAQIHEYNSIRELLESHRETEAIKEDVQTALDCLPQIMKGGI